MTTHEMHTEANDAPCQADHDAMRARLTAKANAKRDEREAKNAGNGYIKAVYARRLADVVAAIEIAVKVRGLAGENEEMGLMRLLCDAKGILEAAA